jgi:hypothetical protein
MKFKIMALVLSVSCLAQADVLWKKKFWGWGQATSTNVATSKALENARPVIAEMRAQCDSERGILTYATQGGYCTTTTDPMFCPNGCYTCPIYGTSTCTFDATADMKVGVLVEVTVDSNMMTGTTIVGKVKAGEKYHISAIQKPWASLTALDGKAVKGWIQMSALKLATR